MQQHQKRVLVISGGGSRGAWGGGLLKALHEKENPDYKCIVGTSTGSLLAPLVALKAFEKMEVGFTDVTQRTIFNKNPFNGDGNIKMVKAAISIVRGKENLGETHHLKKRIYSFFTKEDYDALQQIDCEVKVSVVSLTTNKVQFPSSKTNTYNDMVDWVWASANQPIFMSVLTKNNEQWVDGGIKDNVPVAEGLRFAKEHGIKNIDVVVNNQEGAKTDRWPELNGKSNVIPKLLRIIDIFSDEVRLSDIESGVLQAEVNDMNINVYFMEKEEYDVSPKSLFFKKDILKKLWKMGYEHNFNRTENLIVLPGGNRINIR